MNSKILFKASLYFIATPLIFLIAKPTFAASLDNQYWSGIESKSKTGNTILLSRDDYRDYYDDRDYERERRREIRERRREISRERQRYLREMKRRRDNERYRQDFRRDRRWDNDRDYIERPLPPPPPRPPF
ncbi:hypothetical protein [Brasilonema sp. UFV-L1]|uniref:hypothetical protein n=1 Tax=Brasilonema sp. UFV-L1 TaxID=2234130 RepID=UPI00145DAA87|nr:hypothetical protein [Brasilonema sp. UFV-L1]NMG09585.1 hypothetical protein [Brasilonema sp. UFV-L1]